MLLADFDKQMGEQIAPLYHLKGEDSYSAGIAFRRLKALCDEMDLSVFGPEDDIADAIAAARCFPLMGERRVVAICDVQFESKGKDGKGKEKEPKESKGKSADKTALTAYAADPTESTVLVLYRTDWAPKGAVVCDFVKPKPYQTEAWLVDYCRQEGVKMDRAACRLLVEYCEADSTRILAEMQKLVAFAYGNPITERDVRAVTTPDANYQVYEFSDRVARGDYVGALRILDKLTKSPYEYTKFLGLLVNHYRTAYYRKISALSDEDLGKALDGRKAYAVKKAGETAECYTPTALYRLMQSLYATEYALKSGRMTPEQAMQTALVEAVERRYH